MRDDFWRTAAGADATRMMQEYYGDIIMALQEHSFMLRETDKPRSDCLHQLADKLFTRRASGDVTTAAETKIER